MPIVNNFRHSFKTNIYYWDKYVYTLIISWIHLSYGISKSTIGPAFIDLKYVLNTTIDKIALITLFISIGNLSGSLFGCLYKYINREITIMIVTLFMSFSNAFIPYTQQLYQLYLCNLIYGIGSGAWVCAKNVWIIEMWHKNSASVLQLTGFMYGIGTFLGPLIDGPYLTGEQKTYFNQTLDSNTTEMSITYMNDNIERRSKLKIPFLISGFIQMIGSILLLIMFLVKRYENIERYEEISDNNENIYKKRDLDITQNKQTLIISLICIFLAFHMSSEEIYLQFSATYFQLIPLKLTASQSAEMVSVMALTFTICRGIYVFISMGMRPQITIAYHLPIIFISMIILYLARNSLTILWIGSLTMSLGICAIFPSIYGFTGRLLEVTNRMGTLFLLSSEFFNLFIPYIIGLYIENYPNIFLLSIVSNLLITYSVFIIIIYILYKNFRYF